MDPAAAKKAKEDLAFFDNLFPIYVDGFRLMGRMQALAKQKGLNEGELRTAVLSKGAVDSIYPKVKDYTSADYDKAMADAELKPMLEQLIDLRRKYAFTFADPRRGENWSAITGDLRDTTAGKPLNDRLDALIRDASIWAWPRQNWYGCCSMTFATPCSDGQRVYVAFPSNQVAAYDLAGKQQWLTWEHPPANQKQDGVIHCRFVPSPLLVAGRLVVNQNGELRVYDAKTGAKVWGLWDPYEKTRDKRDKTRGSRNCRPYPEACSPVAFRLPLGNGTLDVITDGGGNLYRLDDGVVVGKGLPGLYKGASPIAVGDLYIWKSGGDNRPYPLGVCRLKATSRDAVESTALWTDEQAKSGEFMAMVQDGVIYNGNGAWDLLTGTRKYEAKMGSGWNSPILVGGVVIGARGTGLQTAATGAEAGRATFTDEIAKEDPEWERKVYCGMAGTFGNSSFYAQANRVFFRTAGHLWCLGDKAQPQGKRITR